MANCINLIYLDRGTLSCFDHIDWSKSLWAYYYCYHHYYYTIASLMSEGLACWVTPALSSRRRFGAVDEG